jgi:hypothetical protein
MGFPAFGRAICERILAAGIEIEDHDDERSRAFARLAALRPPARKGNPPGDCLIVETYLRLVRELRAAGFDQKVVFISSNTRDFHGPAGPGLHPDLRAEFDPIQMDFWTGWNAARNGIDS